MPQPFNYSLGLPDPSQNFLQGLQVAQAMAKQQAAQQAVDNRNNVLKNLMALENPTADDYAKAALMLPEDREALKQSWDMHEQSKRDALFKAGSDAFMLASGGDNDGAKAKLEEWAAGFENSGDDAAAQQLRTAAKLVETDPKAAKTTIGMMLSFADGERFKNVAGGDPQLDTTIIKNLVAEGLEPGSDEFKAALKEERRKVNVFIPNVGFISGTPEYIQSVVGGPVPADTRNLPRPADKGAFDALPPGAEYVAPDGSIRRKPGGTSGNAGGGFRPVSDATPIIRSLFPQATITSGHRGPKDPLTVKNPNSYHAKSHAAVDIAPIKGMTFAQAKAAIEAKGYSLIEAIDEVNHPSTYSTGPHWHFVIGER